MTAATPAAPGEAGSPQRPGSAAGAADPTLLELARGGSKWAYAGIGVLILGALIALLSVTVLRPGKPKGGGASVRVDGTQPYKLDYARGELKIASQSGGSVVLVDKKADDPTGSSRLVVTPQQLPVYTGSPSGALPLSTAEAEEAIAKRFDPGSVRFTEEGLVNIGPNPGYQLSYVAKRDGATWYGRAAVVVPDVDGERNAVLMDGQEERVAGNSHAIKSPRAVGRQGDLRRPMKSLVFLD